MTVPPPPSDAGRGSPADAGRADAEPARLDDLVRAAHRTHVVVIGGGIAGLVAALECAKVGLRVTLLEAAADLGGTIRGGEVGGMALDLGPDGWSRGGGELRALADELGLGDRVTSAAPESPWVAGAPFGAAPLPAEQVAGVPANPWDPRVRRIIGWRGAWRAYLDRLRPPLTIGAQRNLGALVRGRMGDLVADRLVAPVSVGRYALTPDEIDVEYAAPGLSTALTRTGSLSGGVSQLLASSRPPLETIEGGLHAIVSALRERLVALEVDVRVDTTVRAVERVENAGPGAQDAARTPRWRVLTVGDEAPLPADAVVVAASESEARRLLAPLVPSVAAVETRRQEVVTLVVDEPRLDGNPRGTVVYPVPGSVAGAAPVASVAQVSARWPWLHAEGSGAHVLRVSFLPREGDGEASPPAAPAGAELVAAAVRAAYDLLDVPLPEESIRGARVERFDHVPPASALGRAAEMSAVTAAVHRVPGLAVAGAWVSGSGLAAVVPDAQAAAERVRRSALFGPQAAV